MLPPTGTRVVGFELPPRGQWRAALLAPIHHLHFRLAHGPTLPANRREWANIANTMPVVFVWTCRRGKGLLSVSIARAAAAPPWLGAFAFSGGRSEFVSAPERLLAPMPHSGRFVALTLFSHCHGRRPSLPPFFICLTFLHWRACGSAAHTIEGGWVSPTLAAMQDMTCAHFRRGLDMDRLARARREQRGGFICARSGVGRRPCARRPCKIRSVQP
jgi:hypothetical protein